MSTAQEHYQMAESLTMTAAGVMDYDHGLYASMGTQERLQRRAALTAEAQVHATLALAAATALYDGDLGKGADTEYQAWKRIAGSEVTR